METKTTKYTKEGYQALVDELNYLKGEKTEEVKQSLAQARSYGDLSENSEYDEAKNEQARVATRIAELEELITHAEIIDESELREDVINLGSTVLAYDYDMEEEVEYSIVGTNESDPMRGRISDRSPIGSAMIGKVVGDIVNVVAPGGELKFKILSVERTKNNG
ncbi:MAG: transcription elongation factor GreA [Clostridia bacterium]|nr:transcription elongation factor GreA [Oscillospiraceae bacterium]MBO4931653.1 transcription elongation factor GreA [Clostridia bacterium]MBO5255867.1 transcription elongation factor GreA [Clostridia bacterium]